MTNLPALLRENPYSWADRTRGELAVLRQEHPDKMGDFHAQVEAALAGVQARFGRASEEFAAVAEVRVDLLREWGVLLGERGRGRPAKGEKVAGCELTKDDRHRARKLAAIDADDFADLLLACRDKGKPPTVAGLIRAAEVARIREDAPPTQAVAVSNWHDLADRVRAGEQEPFGTVYCDPPWKYGNQGTRGATDNHYATMTQDELLALPVSDVAAERAHLHLWTTNVFLPDALELISAWGFRYVSMMVWAKKKREFHADLPVMRGRLGIGNYWRVSHELMLLGVRGKKVTFARHDKHVDSVQVYNPTKHSAKPPEVRELIETTSPGPYLEMFAREAAPGWTAWGNEVTS